MEDHLGVLLLPVALEQFELAAHARSLLEIPRVLALEPGRVRTPRVLRDAAALRQARRLRLPGRPRLLVLYDPAQYPLARALRGRYEDLELWYVPPAAPLSDGDLRDFDQLARDHAIRTLARGADAAVDPAQAAGLRERLRELGVISPYAFVGEARRQRR